MLIPFLWHVFLLAPYVIVFVILLHICVFEKPGRVSEDYRYWIAMIPALYAVACIALEASRGTTDERVGPSDGKQVNVAILYAILVIRVLLEMAALVAMAVLCALLSRRIRLRPARWLVVAPVWAFVGLGLMSVAALGSDFLQATLNNRAFRRMTPDDYREMIDPHARAADYDALDILDHPSVMDGYGWWQMTLAESVFICLIAITAALMLRISASTRLPAAAAVPAAVLLLLILYCQWVAPWVLIIDYDNFVGDRILGSVAYDLVFLFFNSSPVSATVFAAYGISIALFFKLWPADGTSGQHV